MFKKMTKKKTSKQLAKISPKKKPCDKYETIMTEDKIGVTKSKKDKPSATFNVNAPEDDKKLLKTQGKQIKKKKKKYNSKVHNINNLKNANAAVPSKKRHYSQIDECFVLLSDFNEHKKNLKSDKASTSNITEKSSKNDKDYSSMLKTKEQSIKKKKKEDSKVQNINNLINDNAVAHTKKRQYSQMKECFVLLKDCYEQKKNHKSHKASTSNNANNSSENNKDYSSMLKTKEQNIKKKKKEDSKVQNINNLINDNAVAHTKKRQYSQMKECFVLLSDCYENKKNLKSHKASTSNNANNSSENNKDYSSIFKTRGKNIKIKNKYKIQKINNLENDYAAIHTEKSQLKECFVLLSDFDKNKKIIHKPNKASSRKKTMIGSENNKEYLSILGTQGQNIKKIYKKDSKVKNIKKF